MLAAACQKAREKQNSPGQNQNQAVNDITTQEPSPSATVDFSALSPVYLFSAKIPDNLKAEYLPQNQSINIYDPTISGANNLDKSQIFIRYFKATSFLTLPTVNILKRDAAEVNGHAAVRYEIEKNPGAANFPNQPLWRSQKHKLIDIRLEPSGTTYFYVFAYHPNFPAKQFEDFIGSLIFQNDELPSNLKEPITDFSKRITKKPFGIKVSPQNSPVSPERFSGFHNAVDFEILEGEENADVEVFAVCEGKLLQKQSAAGYGGVAVQSCGIDGQAVTVIYGHLRLNSITYQVGENIQAGEKLAVLGKGNSEETGGERKHLHLGIHKGADIDIRGYVQRESELGNWIDFVQVFEE